MNIEEIENRYNICNKCPICDTEKGICNSRLYLNPQTGEISIKPKKNYIKGCGCLLEKKIPNPNKHCPANKW